MSNGKGSALTIIALIIGAGGLGVGVFSMFRFQIVEGPQGDPGLDGTDGDDGLDGTDGDDGLDGTDGDDGLNGTLNNVVGIWEGMSGMGYDFNITLTAIQLNNSEFFDLTDSGRALLLLKVGWYKFSIKCYITGLTSADSYYLEALKNGVTDEIIDIVYVNYNSAYMINTFVYVYSDGDDIFYLNCYTDSENFFSIYSDLALNEFVLEYVKES